MSDPSHKTVFLLDHTMRMREPCGIAINIDKAPQSCQSFLKDIPPVMKSLWSCAVENSLEYARILWDIYGDSRLFRVLAVNPESTESLNEWDITQQNTLFLSEAFANAGTPTKENGLIQNGIKSAIAALQEPSQLQKELMKVNTKQVPNKGRVVCLTSHNMGFDLAEYFEATLNEQNQYIEGSKNTQQLPVQECEFTLISLHLKSRQSSRISTALHNVSSKLRAEVWVVEPHLLHDKMNELCMRHHSLVVTTVTGIPMKVEQNSNSSSNYDVALVHPRLSTTSSDNSVLKWSPRTSQKTPLLHGISHPCSTTCRVTPANITSRPSNCLSNFVVGGRSVWLDMLNDDKPISHVLNSHGGEIWMHIMESSRNILEDPPSITEGIGGRVTDYRIMDFVQFMKLNKLIPYGVAGENQAAAMPMAAPTQEPNNIIKGKPNEMAKRRIIRKSQFWPITIGESVIFSMSSIQSFLNLILQDTMTDLERIECESKLFDLMTIESRGDPPPIPSAYVKKGQKREHQWENVYSELESFIKNNLHSDNHRRLLICFQETRPQFSNKETSNYKTEKLGNDSNALCPTGNRKSAVIVDSGMPPSNKRPKVKEPLQLASSANLLQLWRKKTEKKDLRVLQKLIKLYPNLNVEDVEKSGKDIRGGRAKSARSTAN